MHSEENLVVAWCDWCGMVGPAYRSEKWKMDLCDDAGACMRRVDIQERHADSSNGVEGRITVWQNVYHFARSEEDVC